jgi:capsular polysaccharide biosynthesis protein
MLGLLLGLGITGLLEYLDTTLKTEDDVRMVLNLPVIATIPVLIERRGSPRVLRTRLLAALRG